ncbi:RNA polymerase sigma factor [Clostridium sp. 19966]|uniref:RNA polymerase sigma factor n=1 Tax=Clostridium sp. 19966 TaxID=2768166 RepID=UPI0028DFD23B|nr:RNA polymerase sigma factor [Clostridium sp. 19966]MDT8718394.1 RNA polymerase sigma factor [Clostridium sp. 19966]
MDIELYAKKIFGFSLSKTNNIQDAEDLSQEILMNLHNSSEKIHKVENADAYVYKICAYTWSNFYRKQKRHWRNIPLDITVNLKSESQIDALLEQNEKNRLLLLIRKELAYMNKLYREILIKNYFENKTIKDISKELSIPEGTIKWYMHDAKAKLKASTVKERNIEAMNNTMQSYRPIKLDIGYSGSPGATVEPNSYFKSLLYQNIAYAAYKKPLSSEEISRKLEVACCFVEEALDELCKADLMLNKNNKYQAQFYIAEAEDNAYISDFIIEKSEIIAPVMYKIFEDTIESIRTIGFIGSDLNFSILLWSLYPYYLLDFLMKTQDYIEFSASPVPEHIDGGKYVVSGTAMRDNEIKYSSGKYENIYPRLESKGIKTRETDSNIFSFQIDSYFSGLQWREFNGPDLDKLWHIASISKNNIEPNEFEKLIIAEYIDSGYLYMDNKQIKFSFPLMTKEEKEAVDKIINDAAAYTDIIKMLEGTVTHCYALLKKGANSAIPDEHLKLRACGTSYGIILSTLEYVERNNIIRIPSEKEKLALSTMIWHS